MSVRVSFGAAARAAFGACVSLSFVSAVPARAWTPDPAQAARLAAPVSVGGFQVRPPRGYETRVIHAGKESAFAWAGPPRPSGLRPFLLFTRFMPDTRGGSRTLPQNLSKFSALDAKTYPGYKASPIESGTINGFPFARLRWSGRSARTRRGVYGFDYLGRAGGKYFLIGAATPADAKAALALLEASALTFRVKVK